MAQTRTKAPSFRRTAVAFWQSLAKDLFGNPFLVIKDGSDAGIHALFDPNLRDDLATLQIGKPVAVRGTVGGLKQAFILLKDCSVVP